MRSRRALLVRGGCDVAPEPAPPPRRAAQAHCEPVRMQTATDYRRELSETLDRPLRVYHYPLVRCCN